MSYVKIGHALKDEINKLKNGKAGDQNLKEVLIAAWYLHIKGWIVIRPINSEDAEMIAMAMESACLNEKIGYDQISRLTLYNEAKKYNFDISKITKAVECDCSALVRVCLAYAGIKVDNFRTKNELEVLKKTGKFKILTSDKYCKSSKFLKRGDILVTRTSGHTIIILTNGSAISTKVLSLDDCGIEVEELQKKLTACGYSCGNPDGYFGNKTLDALKKFQKDNKLVASGIGNKKTMNKLNAQYKKIIDSSNSENTSNEASIKIDYAKSCDKLISGTYKTTSSLRLRSGAGVAKKIITTIPKGAEVKCYGNYTTVLGVKWFLVKYGNLKGFCSSKYLKKI